MLFNMTNKMILSIIVPIYKVQKYVVKCLESIEQQHAKKSLYDVIVVNDGTPDDSMLLAMPIIHRMGNVQVVNQENQGLSIARNTGLFYAKGEYVWFVDSDDWLLPNAIDEVLDYIKKNPQIPVFSTILELHIEKGNKIKQEYFPAKKELSGKEYLQLKYMQGASQRFIFRKSFLTEYNLSFYPGILHEDGLFGYQMLYFANQVRILERPVYAYRIREKGSIMSSISMRTPKDMLFIHQQLIKFCEEKVAQEDKYWFRLRVFSILINLFLFSKSLAFNSEFSEFYEENKIYFKKEADFVLQNEQNVNKVFYRDAFMLKYFPLLFIRFKYIIRKYILR